MKARISQTKAVSLSLLTLVVLVVPGYAQGTYTANYLGNGIWEQDGNWSTVAYPNNGHFVVINGNPFPDSNPSYVAVIDSPAPCTLGAGVTIQGASLATGSTLNLSPGGSLKLNGPILNSGTISMNGASTGAEMVLTNGSRFEPGSVVAMGVGNNNIYAVNHGDTLTLAPGATVHGAGQLNIGFFGDTRHLLNFVNQGLIQADRPAGSLNIGVDNGVNARMTNTGTLQASGGGTLLMQTFGGPGTILNSGGLVRALDGSIVLVGGGVTVEGGTVTTSDAGVIRTGGSGGKLSNVTSNGRIEIGLNEVLRLAGTMTNSGTIEFQSANPNSGGNLWFAGDTTLSGNGIIEMHIDPYDLITALAPDSTITNTATHTIRGAGRISAVGQVGLEQTFFFTIANDGLIDANIAGKSLSIVLREASGGRLNNTGTLRASGGGNLIFSGNSSVGFVNNNGGTMEALNNSTVTVYGNATVEGGTLTTSGTGAIRTGGSGGKLSNVTNTGRIVIGLNEVLRAAGTITNSGAIDFTSDNPGGGGNFWFAGDTTLSGNGTMALRIDPWDTITALSPNSTITNAAGHTIRGAGRFTSLGQVGLEQTFFFSIANAGLIDANVAGKSLTFILRESDGGRLNNTGTLRASGGGNLSFSGNSGVGFVNNNGGAVEALSGSTLLFDGNAAFVQTAGTINLDGGSMTVQHGLDLNGGQLIGTGTVTGVIRNNGGFVRPGHSPGKITVNGDYTQGANGTLDIEIGGAAPGTEYDQLQVSETAALGGTLNLSLINGFRPAVGDVFQLILQGSFTGAFSTINTTGFTGQVNYSAGAITITVLTVSSTPTPTPTPQPTPSKLLNISTRLRVQTGENVLIGGFVITGTDPKRVIIRGIGPSLSAVGITNALQDPTLELHQGGPTLVTNDNWKMRQDGTSQQAEVEATGIPPANDLESAIVATLNPGAYTAILAGKNDGVGIGLIEAYDLDQAARSKLVNISTRGYVDTGNNVMIGGFIIGGNGGADVRVVIRAIGPSLSAAGITNALPDPSLELRDANGSTLMTNDDWRSTQRAELEATGLAPTNDLESALVTSLRDGNYTAIVRGKGGATGVAVVEVYNIL